MNASYRSIHSRPNCPTQFSDAAGADTAVAVTGGRRCCDEPDMRAGAGGSCGGRSRSGVFSGLAKNMMAYCAVQESREVSYLVFSLFISANISFWMWPAVRTVSLAYRRRLVSAVRASAAAVYSGHRDASLWR